MSSALAGRRALVSGAGRNIGRAVALAFARAGASVALLGRRREPLERTAELVRAAGGRALVLPADVALAEPVRAAVAAAAEQFGGLDLVACLAGGGGALAPLGADDADAWEAIVRANLIGTYRLAREALPLLRAAPRASLLSAAGGGACMPELASGLTAYASSKAAIARLTDQLAVELMGSSVRVNCLLPGPTLDDDERAMLPEAERARWRRPAETAELAVWLASAASEPLSGRMLSPDEPWWRSADRALLERVQADHHALCLRRVPPAV